MEAFETDRKEIFEYLFDKFRDKWDYYHIDPLSGYTLLHRAVLLDDITIFKNIFEKVDLQQLHSISHNIFDTKNCQIKQVVNTCIFTFNFEI